jgi:hypothetical protein
MSIEGLNGVRDFPLCQAKQPNKRWRISIGTPSSSATPQLLAQATGHSTVAIGSKISLQRQPFLGAVTCVKHGRPHTSPLSGYRLTLPGSLSLFFRVPAMWTRGNRQSIEREQDSVNGHFSGITLPLLTNSGKAEVGYPYPEQPPIPPIH